jgi:hypothetical protein
MHKNGSFADALAGAMKTGAARQWATAGSATAQRLRQQGMCNGLVGWSFMPKLRGQWARSSFVRCTCRQANDGWRLRWQPPVFAAYQTIQARHVHASISTAPKYSPAA